MAALITLPRCPLCGLEFAGELPAFCPRPACGVELLAGTPERVRPRTFRLSRHYSLCVLPFTFAEHDDGPLPQRLARGGRWQERRFALDNPEDVDRTEYFLPYIRCFLFPSLFVVQKDGRDPDGHQPTCWHFVFDLAHLGPAGPEGLSLTLRGHDRRKNLGVEHPLLLEAIELVAFCYRVAFLVFRFRGTAPDVTYFDQMEALAYLRAIAPLYRGFEMPELVTATTTYRMETLLPYLLAEFGPGGGVPAPRPAPGPGGPLPVKPASDDRMLVYAFSCLDRETVLPDARRCQGLLERHAVVSLDPKEVSRPRGPGAEPTDWLQTRWQAFTKDGGLLVVFNTDRYHAKYLGVYHGTYYFDIFLLAALQG
jgi:hypothetical protein